MYTTFSVVESIPSLTSRRRRPVSFNSPPHEKQIHVHVQFTPTVHTLRPTSLTLRSYRSTDSVQRLSQTTADELAPPVAQHTTSENLTFDFPTDRSFYNPANYYQW